MENIRLDLTSSQALALAQLVKRIKFTDLRANAINDDEAYVMQEAVAQIRLALSENGFNPR